MSRLISIVSLFLPVFYVRVTKILLESRIVVSLHRVSWKHTLGFGRRTWRIFCLIRPVGFIGTVDKPRAFALNVIGFLLAFPFADAEVVLLKGSSCLCAWRLDEEEVLPVEFNHCYCVRFLGVHLALR
jgi:hypothetical protein